MTKRSGISKWQEKSIKVNQIRWDLEKILSDNFTEEEKHSPKYKELVKSVESVFVHALAIVPACTCSTSRWKMVLLISLCASGGAICLKLLDILYHLLFYTTSVGG